jgi:hypothetical protein
MDLWGKGGKPRSLLEEVLSGSVRLRSLVGGHQFKNGAEIGLILLAALSVVSLNIFSFASWLPNSLYVFIDSVFIINHVSLLVFVYVISRYFGIFVGGFLAIFYSGFSNGLRYSILSEARRLPIADRGLFLRRRAKRFFLFVSGRYMRAYLSPLLQVATTYLVFCYFYLDLGSSLFFSFAILFTLVPAITAVVFYSLSAYRGLRFIGFLRFYFGDTRKSGIIEDTRNLAVELRSSKFRASFLKEILPFSMKIGMLCLLTLSNALGDARANTLLSRLEGELRWAIGTEERSPFASTSAGIIFVKEVFFDQSNPGTRSFSPESASFVFVPFDQIWSFDASVEYRQ